MDNKNKYRHSGLNHDRVDIEMAEEQVKCTQQGRINFLLTQMVHGKHANDRKDKCAWKTQILNLNNSK